ncbi:hypothetical protein G5V58_23405 [Nocardioides anomalus]|uniref:Uncharacterized protein n=1 Tax=Nocardioides anomalus TaxID=2712223 RepID=A0A6G6WJ83_9ACTN|nr:hypothetical protein [Nocardioides anomalus]QIG45304.1 hypothetical protein G5V58_23405 [Nocardioides anomalus]
MRSRVVAPLLAAVLGIGGGVTTALVVDDGGGDEPAASSFNDPLHLRIPQVDQADCTGQALLIVGYGDTAAPLSNAVANASSSKGLRYLRTDSSCPTVMGPEGKDPPKYAVYRGPYDSKQDPCEVRMSGTEVNSFVTVLSSGNEQLVKCPCEIPSSEAPALELGMAVTTESKVWVRALQAMFSDDAQLHPQRGAFPGDQITGIFDDPTSARVAEYQDDAPGQVTERGAVDTATWSLLTLRLCRNYEY